MNKVILFFKWIGGSTLAKRLHNHIKEFSYIWILLIFLLLIAGIVVPYNWLCANKLFGITLVLLTALILIRPMNAVYGLMGTSGSIRLFFFNFLFITVLFACIYHWAFFKDAGISYGVNQPHINYQFYAHNSPCDPVREKRDTVLLEHQSNKLSFNETIVYVKKDTLQYQRIEFMRVWRSTIMTTLTQEPTDLFSIASVHNVSMKSENIGLDKEKSDLFEWILIFHIIISWIFFGVFISLLYNKFRYES